VEKLAQPLDLVELEREGVISKTGAWYRVQDWKALPEHARLKVREFSIEKHSTAAKVKFAKGLEKTATKILGKLQ
jgi:hypothetical protein